ncbi:MAG: hypothetical protein ACU0CT_03480 [Paracoccaceae bacterium]
MVDEIDKEMTLEECHAMIDRLRERLRAIKKGLTSKEIPEPYILMELGHYAEWPADWERGKALQRDLGSEAIPYKTECESGAGLWARLNRPD